jgi:hypothetical protein
MGRRVCGAPHTRVSMQDSMSVPRTQPQRPVLYQVCRAGDRFEVGDGPFDLGTLNRLVLGRGSEGGYDSQAVEDTIRVPDPWMSSRHASLNREPGGFRFRDEGSTNGVLVNGHPVGAAVLQHGDVLETGRTFWVYTVVPKDAVLPVEPVQFGGVQTWHPAFAQQLQLLARLAKTGQGLLLLGEPGTGKRHCALAVHNNSGRAGRFIELDCSRVAADRVLAELCGAHEPKTGTLYQASGGTLYLARVESLPLPAQDLLAQVLDTQKVTALDGAKAASLDLRLVVAAEADVEHAVARGRFSARLMGKLTGGMVRMTPLRERREDLGLVMDGLLQRAEGAHTITRDACRALVNYAWPRNTRELSKVLQGAAILAADEELVDLRHLPAVVALEAGVEEPGSPQAAVPSLVPPNPDADQTSPGDDGLPVLRAPPEHPVLHHEQTTAGDDENPYPTDEATGVLSDPDEPVAPAAPSRARRRLSEEEQRVPTGLKPRETTPLHAAAPPLRASPPGPRTATRAQPQKAAPVNPGAGARIIRPKR